MKNLSVMSAASALQLVFGCSSTEPVVDGPNNDVVEVTVAGLVFVPFEGGTFTIGRNGQEYAEPPVEVTVRPFLIMQREVTYGMYLACVKDGLCEMPDNTDAGCIQSLALDIGNSHVEYQYPMNCVSWTHAWQFARWFGHGARLPTEVEWEFAATQGTGRPYPWGAAPPTCERVARSAASAAEEESLGCQRGIQTTCAHPAGNTPTPRVLCDMAGNVAELVEDDFHPSYDCRTYLETARYSNYCAQQGSIPTNGDAWVDEPRQLVVRVAKGGNHQQDDAESFRTTVRQIGSTEFGGDNSGFRLARDVD